MSFNDFTSLIPPYPAPSFDDMMQDTMDLSNPVFEHRGILDDDFHGGGSDSPNLRARARSEDSNSMLTEADSAKSVKSGGRQDSKRGSGASTPRDGVAGFLHEGGDGVAHARSAMTPPAQAGSRTVDSYTSPTSRPATKLDPKTLLSPKGATFDRKALLSSKGAKAARGSSNVVDLSSDHSDGGENIKNVNLYENLHRVQPRSEVTSKRRQIASDADGDDDETRKKKAKFDMSGGGGVMTEFIRDEKTKDVGEIRGAADVAAAIDLTNDTPTPDDGEMPTKPQDDPTVVYGQLEPNGDKVWAHVSNIPRPKRNGIWTPSSTRWPPIAIRLVHDQAAVIRLVDPMRQRFANLDIKTAMVLVSLMQTSWGITFKAYIPARAKKEGEHEGDGTSQSLAIVLKILGPRSKAGKVGNYLQRKNFWLRNCPVTANEILHNPQDVNARALERAGMLPGNGHGSASIASSNLTAEEMRSDVTNMFDQLIQTQDLPEAEQPANVKTEMLSHQKQGLYFLKMREEDQSVPKTGGEAFHLWKPRHEANGRRVYYNVITGTEMKDRPPVMRVGILADMMGLGKTLSMLSLVAQGVEDSKAFANRPPPIAIDADLRTNSRATLLVCPLSVVANWEIQIKEHLKKGTLKTLIYHGPARTSDYNELSDYDVVITSYQTIAHDYKKPNMSPLRRINWFRIILDEAHIIRNPTTGMATSICALNADRRWAVTGTPVQNRLDDLGSLIKFLRIKPFDEKNAFAQYILAPFKTADPEILPKLRLLVDSITLRRLKDNIDLPSRSDQIVRLEFSKEEKALYEIFVRDSKTKVELLATQEKMGGKSYAQILKSIMRLRLICAHGEELLNDEDRKLLEGLSEDKAIDLTDEADENEPPKMSKKVAFDMLEMLRSSGLDDCPRCGDKIGGMQDDENDNEDEVRADTNTIGHMTGCFHIICPKCFPKHDAEIQQAIIEEMNQRMEEGEDDPVVNTYTCAYCQSENVKTTHYAILQSELDEEAEEKRRLRANPKLARQMGFYRGPHTKTKALIEYLKTFEAESHDKPDEPPIKSVVFSTWTSHLDLIQIALTANNIAYTRLDGSMSRRNRAAAINDFTNDPATTVILVTIGAGGLGLNLTVANKVFVMEPQFNPAAEQQAIDRVHRLGQTREVTNVRFIMRDSFEENMLKQQEKKVELADLAMTRKKLDRAEAAKAKMESLKSLFR